MRFAGFEHATAESSVCVTSFCLFGQCRTGSLDSDFALYLDGLLHPAVNQCSRQSLATDANSTRTGTVSIRMDATESMETPEGIEAMLRSECGSNTGGA